MRVICDESTKQKAGRQSEGIDRYRHGAGSARQAYRTLRGVTCVLGIMPLPLQWWPGHRRSIPVGFARSLTPGHVPKLGVPYRSRSQLARDILDVVAAPWPERHRRSLADGGYATQDYVRQLPAAAHVVGRFPSSAQLYE